MAGDYNGGDAVATLKWVVVVMVILGFAWLATGGPSRPAARGGPFLKPLAPVDSGETYGRLGGPSTSGAFGGYTSSGGGTEGSGFTATPLIGTADDSSPWSGKIQIQKGSASSAIQPNDEYIIIRNISRSSEPINISGWVLKNAGTVQGDSGILRGSQRSAVIPRGAVTYFPNQENILESIVLNKGERAVITSGRIPNLSPYPITASFKTNLCTGYLGRLPYYRFRPSLSASCPNPEDEPGVETVDDDCFRLIRGLGRCETPEFKIDPQTGEETVDGRLGVSYSCKNFLKLHYNYVGCLAFHRRQENFPGKEWRVFLNTLPLWAKDRETIYLYDHLGRLVTSLSY